MPASTRPGIGPGPNSTTLSSTPGARHAVIAAVAAVLELRRGVSSERERARRSSSGGGTEVAHDSDLMLEQVAHGPLGARRLVVVLVGPHAGDDIVGVVEGLLQGVEELHPGPLSSV